MFQQIFSLKKLVNSQLEHVLYHPRQEHLQQAGAFFQTRVRVDLDQPKVKVLIKDEIVAKKFKAVFSAVWIDLLSDSVESLADDALHLGD